MKIPLSWIREFATLPKDVDLERLENAFVSVGFEVEGIDVQGSNLTGPLVVARVINIEELVGNKKPIRYVELDCGEAKTRFVICGATNFAVGDLVVAALPGAILPGDFAISARETYGKTSNGMICSARELGMSDEHSGIIVLPIDCAKVGANAVDLLEINDVIFDIAVNPDRGYALSVRGLARELAAALGCKYQDPAHSVKTSEYEVNKKGIQISVEDKASLSIIYIRTISDFKATTPTPLWMSRRIEKCGMRSISLAVDITNYVMLELGQPLHAFDADVLHGGLRVSGVGRYQKLITLDKVDRKLFGDELLICDDSGPQALAGTMGGLNSEVTNATKKIALEAAHFYPNRVAKNSRLHGLSSEASRRIERGTDSALTSIASARATQLLEELAGAKFIGTSYAGTVSKKSSIKINSKKIDELIGFTYSSKQIKDALVAIGCKVVGSGLNLSITAPSWRPDLNTTADFAEEIARLNDYALIPSSLPIGKKGAQLNQLQQRKRVVAQMLASQGLTEVINYPFTNQEMVDLLGFTGDRAKSFKIANPMSEEYPLLRTHLIPGLLTTLQRNLSRGAKNVAIFEIGSVFRNTSVTAKAIEPDLNKKPSAKVIEEIYAGVPKQMLFVGGLLTGESVKSGWQGKGLTFTWQDAVAKAIEIVELSGNNYELIATELAPWHPGRCAEIKVNGKAVAHAGELHPRVCSALNLPERTCVFAVILSELPFVKHNHQQKIWSFPAVVQDVALVVDENVTAASVEQALVEGAGELLESVELFDRYDQIGGGKISLAFTLTFRSSDQTLTADQVAKFRDSAISIASKKCGAQLR